MWLFGGREFWVEVRSSVNFWRWESVCCVLGLVRRECGWSRESGEEEEEMRLESDRR